jgi:hypothetical protein
MLLYQAPCTLLLRFHDSVQNPRPEATNQVPALAAELVGRPESVIAAFSTVGVLATKAPT